VTAGWGLISRCVMSLSEILLLVMGAFIFAASLSLAIGIEEDPSRDNPADNWCLLTAR
jgi:hypothetical protein